MLRDTLIYALYEEITANCFTRTEANNKVNGLEYLTMDEADCLMEMLEDWYGD